jgi:Ca2+-binding RTX toxin-like protein
MTYFVTTNLDVTDPDDGLLSLREALVLTNARQDDNISFDDALRGKTLELQQGELRISSDVFIDGNDITIDAHFASRVFNISNEGSGGSDLQVTLAEMTIANGSTAGVGGGIYAQGDLALIGCSVINNRAENGLASSGGGIYGESVHLNRTTISGNYTYSIGGIGLGGGIAASALTAVNSTIVGNQAVSGSDQLRGYGGGVGIIGDGTASIVASTITGNYAGFQGGGISGGMVSLANSIVVGNAALVFGAEIDGATIESNGRNLFGEGVATKSGDLVNLTADTIFATTAPILALDVLGGVPGDNGGPTQTVALLDSATNPALGRALPNDLTTDQRNEPRPGAGGHPDIGAFELEQSHDVVEGAPGNRLLRGSGEHEALLGLSHDEVLRGHRGHDLLDGGDGADRLQGGPGGDVLIGGGGPDRFVFRVAAHSAPAGPDLILDFSQADGDRIVLGHLDGDLDRPGQQPLEFIGRQRFTDSGQVMERVVDGRTVIRVNLDEDRPAELRIELHDAIDLHRGDFVL